MLTVVRVEEYGVRNSCNKRSKKTGGVNPERVLLLIADRWWRTLMKKHQALFTVTAVCFTATRPGGLCIGEGSTVANIKKLQELPVPGGHCLLAHHFGRFLGGSKRSLMLLLQCPIIELHAIELLASFFFSLYFFLWRCSIVLSKSPFSTLGFAYAGCYWDLGAPVWCFKTTNFCSNLSADGRVILYVNSATFGGLVGAHLLFFRSDPIRWQLYSL
jgi:hypothetical protein